MKKDFNIKTTSKEILNDIVNVMKKLNTIDDLPTKPDPAKGVKYSSDFLFLQALRHELSMLNLKLQNYISYKNKNGWDVAFDDVEIEKLITNPFK